MCGGGVGLIAVRAIKRFISNKDMDDIIRTIKSLEKARVLTDGVTETVKHGIKKQEDGYLVLC